MIRILAGHAPDNYWHYQRTKKLSIDPNIGKNQRYQLENISRTPIKPGCFQVEKYCVFL
jgi:hypothetical protein